MKNLILLPFLFIFFNIKAQENTEVLNIFFSSNSAQLSNASKKEIKTLFDSAKPGEFRIEKIIGFCDSTGKTANNIILAEKRIKAVEQFIHAYKIEIPIKTPFGENYPSNAKNTNDLAYWRRVEIHYSILIPTIETEIVIPNIHNQFNDIKLDSIQSENADPIVLNIQFMPGTDVLIGNSFEEIQNLFDFMRYNTDAFAFIRGHVCCADDMELSFARAFVVYSMLLERGIPPSRMKFQGFSNTMPAVSPEVLEEHRQKNRRVDVVFSRIH